MPNKQAKKKKTHLSAIAHTSDRSLHTLYQKGNKTQSLCFDAKRSICHQDLYFQIDFCAWFFFCIPLYICQECKGTKTSEHLCNLLQLSGRYSQTETATVRFYFTLVRVAIITSTSVIIPFDVWWKKTKRNKLGKNIKNFEPYVLLMKIWYGDTTPSLVGFLRFTPTSTPLSLSSACQRELRARVIWALKNVNWSTIPWKILRNP